MPNSPLAVHVHLDVHPAYTPADLLANLEEELAHGTGARQPRSGQPRRVKQIASSAPAAPLSTRLRR